jgi:hypothetical protein
MNVEDKEIMKTKGFGWRVSFSIISVVGWLIFLIIWLFFYATDFNVYQNIAIFIVSLLAFGGIMGAVWAPWGIKYGDRFEKKSGYRKEISNTIKKEIRKEIDEELEKKSKK